MARQTIPGPYHVVSLAEGFYEVFKGEHPLIPPRTYRQRQSAYRLMAQLNKEATHSASILRDRDGLIDVMEDIEREAYLHRYTPLEFTHPDQPLEEMQHCQIRLVESREILTTSYVRAVSFLEGAGYYRSHTTYEGRDEYWRKGQSMASRDGKRSYYLFPSQATWGGAWSPGNCEVRCSMDSEHAKHLGLSMENMWTGIIAKEANYWKAMSLAYQHFLNTDFNQHIRPAEDNPHSDFPTAHEAVRWLIHTNELYALNTLHLL